MRITEGTVTLVAGQQCRVQRGFVAARRKALEPVDILRAVRWPGRGVVQIGVKHEQFRCLGCAIADFLARARTSVNGSKGRQYCTVQKPMVDVPVSGASSEQTFRV